MDKLQLDFHVDPHFVHRTLASQAFGIHEVLSLGSLADRITEQLHIRDVPDLRVAAIEDKLATVHNSIVRVRSTMYFKYFKEHSRESCRFHRMIPVDTGKSLSIEGRFDPSRFEADSPRDILSRQRNVYIVGIATSVEEDPHHVEIRPLLIGIPYYVPRGTSRSPLYRNNHPAISYSNVDQFCLDQQDFARPVTRKQALQLFSMSEREVKKAFASLLGVPWVPQDWPGENSDLTADLTVQGEHASVAFAFKGPGGKPSPWTLHPSRMGKNGDQGIRLLNEATDIMVVQHCGPIASTVYHMMEALAVARQKRYMVLDYRATVRILRRANLLKR